MMRLGIASWSFFLISLLILLAVKEGGSRKLATRSVGDHNNNNNNNNQLSSVPFELQQLATEVLSLTHTMQVEEGTHVQAVKKHDDDDDDDDDDVGGNKDDKKHKEKRVKKEEDDGDKKHNEKHVKKEEDDDDDDEDDHKKKKEKVHKHDEHKKPSQIDHNHMDPELNVFFTPKDLSVGKKLPIFFSKKNDSSSPSSPKFLPREEAEQIPFSSKKLHSLLKFFSIPKHSPQAKAMKYTLKQCEFEPMEGETKFCATSLESLLDFARYLFGKSSQLKVMTTTFLKNSIVPLQNYTVTQVEEISVPNVIGCHPMPYPYAVFYCHSQQSDTNLYEVLVEGENGGKVQAPAICHMNTSMWDADHVSFRVLNITPGTSPVCHFFPPDNLVWVPLPAAS